MKNRDEYLESIYAKRDAKIKERKKRVSVLTSIVCLAVCFAAAFAFVPRQSGIKTSSEENASNTVSANNPVQTTNEECYIFNETYLAIYNQDNQCLTDDSVHRSSTDSEIKSSKKHEAATSDNRLQTEIAIEIIEEKTTGNKSFGYIGEPFDPDSLPSKPSFGGFPALAPAEPPDDFGTEVTEPYIDETPGSEKTKASTTVAKPKSSEEAIVEAKNFLFTISKDDSEKIIDEKTQATVTRTANGKTTYTVFLYTNSKSFEIEVDGVTLNIIGCKQKYLVSGYETYISPAYYPETTAALPEYKPQ